MNSPKIWYTVYLARTDEIVAMGDTDTCAAQLGMRPSSFRSIVHRAKLGLQSKYEILAEPLSAAEWAALTGKGRYPKI